MLAAASFVMCAQPRNRNFIRQKIREHNQCRNVAITQYNGDLMLYGQNGWAADGCPKGLTDALHDLNDKKEYINDVQLTEKGNWIILYGKNGFRWSNIPYSLEKQLRRWNYLEATVNSVTFNDSGDWILVSSKYIRASTPDLEKWINEGIDEYGKVRAACVTEDACVVVYQKGYKVIGNIPSTLIDKLKTTNLNVYRLKIAGESWFMSDGERHYDYNM